ncbi:SH3 domain-containing protein [Salirhabdus salicampi]|uniref:SH3 domain-containing protein n=1 Tax=Salirhabdus salicampi TaxID=476102 RepID=UPI0020C2556D|nr:SH3 domain-containing protein [Salirhabdus salicampi]
MKNIMQKKIGLVLFVLLLQLFSLNDLTVLGTEGESASINEHYQGTGFGSPTEVYASPDREAEVLKSYKKGTNLKYRSYTEEWHEATVYVNGKPTTGYINVNDVETTDSYFLGIGLKDKTHVYADTSREANQLKSYAQGTVLKYRSHEKENWYEATVYVNGKPTTGYIHVNDVETSETSQDTLYGVGLKKPNNVYAKASTQSKVLKSYGQGTILKYKSFTSGWYEAKVYVDGKPTTGYINTNDTDNIVENSEVLYGIGLKQSNNVYAKASTDSKVLKSYDEGTVLKYETFTSGWYKATVYIKGKRTTGYINVNHTENIMDDTETLNGIGLKNPTKVFAKASRNANVLKSYAQGTVLKYETFTSKWLKATVYLNGKRHTGYIHKNDVDDKIENQEDREGYLLEDPTKIYAKASTSADVLKTFPQGHFVQMRTYTSEWYEMVLDVNGTEKTGYVRKDEISFEPLETSYLDVHLRKPADLTAQDIVDFFNRVKPDSDLKNFAQHFIDVQNEVGINAQYLVAHAIWETGWGGSTIRSYKKNLYGYKAYDSCPVTCAIYFPTEKDSINFVTYQVINDYLSPGGSYYYEEHGPTLTGMNIKYATDENWKNGIAKLMERMKPFDPKYYSKVQPSNHKPEQPASYTSAIPEGEPSPNHLFIDFNSGVTATVTLDSGNLNFRNLPYLSPSTKIGEVPNGKKVEIVGYNKDVRETVDEDTDKIIRWYRVNVDGQYGWLRGDFLTIDNLIQVDVETSLNIRESATASSNKVGSVTDETFLKVVLTDAGDYVTEKDENDKDWYKVYLPDSDETGWVISDYIIPVK